MTHRTARRLWQIIALVIALFVSYVPDAVSQVGPCEPSDDGSEVHCPKERFQLFRDKGRVGSILCQALDTGTLSVTLPTDLQGVCESADLTSRIWARAETWREHRDAAQEERRRADICEGSLKHCEAAADRYERQRDVARRRARVWRVVAYISGGMAIVSTGAVVGDRVGWWDLTP